MKKMDNFTHSPRMNGGMAWPLLTHQYKNFSHFKLYVLNAVRRHKLITAYFLCIHIFIGLILLTSDFVGLVQGKIGVMMEARPEITAYFDRILRYHARMDGNVPDGAVVFIGDSMTQGLCVSAVAPLSVNYGIGGDTTVGVLQRLPTYHSLQRAGAIVVTIGNNDLKFRSNKEIVRNYSAIIERLPRDVDVIFSAPLPYDEKANHEWVGSNQRLRALNKDLKLLTQKSRRLHFIDAGPLLVDAEGNLADRFHDGDGTHLNEDGNAVWIVELRRALDEASRQAATEHESSSRHQASLLQKPVGNHQ